MTLSQGWGGPPSNDSTGRVFVRIAKTPNEWVWLEYENKYVVQRVRARAVVAGFDVSVRDTRLYLRWSKPGTPRFPRGPRTGDVQIVAEGIGVPPPYEKKKAPPSQFLKARERPGNWLWIQYPTSNSAGHARKEALKLGFQATTRKAVLFVRWPEESK